MIVYYADSKTINRNGGTQVLATLERSEIRMLSQMSVLGPESKRELQEYLEFLVARQCRNEFKTMLLHSNWLFNNLLALSNLNENCENYCFEVLERVKRMKGLCQGVFEQLIEKYGELLGDIKGYEGVAENVIMSLRQIQDAAVRNDARLTRNEILDMLESHKLMAGRGRRPKVRAM